MNVSVTNVPGPPQPVFLAGAPLLDEVVPVVPIGVNLTFGVGALSYAGQFTVIAVADRDACPDVEAFADGMRASLLALAGSVPAVVVRRPNNSERGNHSSDAPANAPARRVIGG
jgi:hypothetical protein